MKLFLTPDRSGVLLFFYCIFLVAFPLSLALSYEINVASSQPQTPIGMVYIPEGYFQMGRSSGGNGDEQPLHYVYTSAYYIDKYEVSNSQYKEFVNATGYSEPPFWNNEKFNKLTHPVVGVSWEDAMAYASWKGGRLPTEAEWEKAARGTDGRPFPWGRKFDKGFFFYFINIYGEDDNFAYTAPVTYYEGGTSPFGLHNMAGNVWEWCLDWYQKNYYFNSPERNPEGPSVGDMKVFRGGSWTNNIDGVEVTRRARNLPATRKKIYGFRIVLPVGP